ncbi:HxlR family transcriptional regulator [Pseudonocardia hierapolitana]|uniref:HxlR family transcriptional regulator n=1 Tax=Pseudonocardia hierapolitana TaxID=1128676 RepID=A0A561SV58_9PSEU|nr:helix-turn-helix domain-containing protein [Pseudonocardia hierapolitana]TWF78748.1 HxlR family transcriptional regulator [Pseudonocardia hierapolitana]
MAVTEQTCSIARSLEVLGERWTFLILREALSGTSRFADFRSALGVAPDILSDRLATLVDAGVLEKRPYREPGARARDSYHLTEAGHELKVVLGALQQWGDQHRPYEPGPTVVRRSADGRPLHVAFVDEEGVEVPLDEVRFRRTSTYPA